jgi:hypothetical protein
MEEGGKIHVPAALPNWTADQYPLNSNLCGPQNLYGLLEKGKIFNPFEDSNLELSDR